MSKFIVFLLVLLNYEKQSSASGLRGARASDGQFPWLIQFQTIAPCGGILVSPDWVLTAAQCVQYRRNSIALFAAGLNGTGSRQSLGVKATYIFPQYKAYSKTRDHEHNIALLKLVKPFDMCNDQVQLLDVAPIRLDEDYKTCLIFGWESYVSPSAKVLAKPIQYSHVLLNSWKLCMYMLRESASHNNVLCTMTESEDGMKACAGNPGSPVVCEDQYRRMILLGIASWSNFSLDCGGIPTYLGVSVFRRWMYDLIFNDREIQKTDSGESAPKAACGYDRYFGSILTNANMRNDSRSWKQGDKLQEKTTSSSRVEGINQDHANDYSEVSLMRGISLDTLRERDDNLKQYQEIGQGKEATGRIHDVVLAFPAGGGDSSHLGNPRIEKESDKDTRTAAKVDLNEFREFDFFGADLDEEYFIGRAYALHFCSRDRGLRSILFFASFCILLLYIF